jgi:hypothetical protein
MSGGLKLKAINLRTFKAVNYEAFCVFLQLYLLHISVL